MTLAEQLHRLLPSNGMATACRIQDNNDMANSISATAGGSRMLYLGIDGGGSKCRAVIVNSRGEPIGEGVGGPANPYQNFQQSLDSVYTATRLALKSAGLSDEASQRLHACLGLAGVNLPAVHHAFSQWQHPYAALLVATDLRVACIGAHAGGDGAVIISGTGSCGFAYVNHQEWFYGAHGFPAGDKGSGAWMGLEAVKHVLLALDGFAEATSLSDALLAQLQATDTISLVEKIGYGASQYAQLAPLVIAAANHGDPVAMAIVKDGADYISKLASKLLVAKPPRLSLIGGLAPLLVPWLAPEIQAQLAPALEQPEMGAVRLAMQTWPAAETP